MLFWRVWFKTNNLKSNNLSAEYHYNKTVTRVTCSFRMHTDTRTHTQSHAHAHTHTDGVWHLCTCEKKLISTSAVRLKRGLPSPPLHSFPSPRPSSSPVAWVCVSLVTHRGPSPATWTTNDPNLLCVTLLEAVVFYNFVQGETRRDLWAVKKLGFFPSYF